jgi:hypothetical protein
VPASPLRPRTLSESLRGWDPAALETLLELRPDLTYPLPQNLTELANRATTLTSTGRALDELDAWQRLVAEALAALPDPSTADAVAELVGGPRPAVVAALADLRVRALVWGAEDALHLVRTAREAFDPYPGGLAPPSPRPLSAAELDAALAACTPEMRTVLDRLLFAPTGAVRHADRPVTPDRARSPVEALLARALLRPLDGDTVLLPREVALRLRGGRLTPGPVASEPPALGGRSRGATLVDRAAGGAAFALLHDVELVVRALEDSPHRPLRTGGLAARDLAGLARTLGTDVTHAAFVVECAAAAGLVAPGSSQGVLPTTGYDRWVDAPAPDRWTLLARAWLTAPRWFVRSGAPGAHALGPEAEAPTAPTLRRVLLEQAVTVGRGTVLDPARLAEVLAWHRPRLTHDGASADAVTRGTWTEAGWLGVVALDAVSGFLPALLAGGPLPADLASLFPELVEQLVVQADLTAVAYGPLRHDVAEDLRLLAEQESRGTGGVYRFSAGSLRRAFDAGWTADVVLDWLRGHSSTDLPQALEYLVADVGRRHGTVRVGQALSFVQTDDDAQLAVLLRSPQAKGLGLRRLAPGVLVAAVEADELVAALRDLGLSPVAEDAAGRGMTPPAPARAPVVRLTPTPATLGAAEAAAAVLAAERRAAAGPSAQAALDQLRTATREGVPVQVTWVEADGRSTVRELAPLDLSAGLVRAVDRGNAEIVTIALSRIAAVSPVAAAG